MIVALETAAAVGGVALVENDRVLAERVLGESAQPARDLLPALDELLRETGRTLAEAEGVALSVGPGSFTGLRIGLATALGLCFDAPLRILPVPTLAALSLGAAGRDPVVPMLDARKGQVYAGVYDGQAEPLAPDVVTDPGPFLESLRRWPRVRLLGLGAHLYRGDVERSLGSRAEILDLEPYGWPRAAWVGLLGERVRRAGGAREPGEVELRYLRPSQAEEKRPAAPLDTPLRNA